MPSLLIFDRWYIWFQLPFPILTWLWNRCLICLLLPIWSRQLNDSRLLNYRPSIVSVVLPCWVWSWPRLHHYWSWTCQVFSWSDSTFRLYMRWRVVRCTKSVLRRWMASCCWLLRTWDFDPFFDSQWSWNWVTNVFLYLKLFFSVLLFDTLLSFMYDSPFVGWFDAALASIMIALLTMTALISVMTTVSRSLSDKAVFKYALLHKLIFAHWGQIFQILIFVYVYRN